MKRIICSLMVLLSFNMAYGWGMKGHDIIASIAESHLTPKAKKHINKALDNRPMTYYATWMDNIRNDNRYAHTSTWHYANVDEGYTYQTMPKNEKGNVVIAVNDVVEILKDKNISDSLETVNLKYLIHMVGDLHCPMHAGRLSDSGGNGVKLKWFGENTSLHTIWDDKIIESSHKWSYSEWNENINVQPRKTVDSLQRGTPEEWFNETVKYTTKIYEVTPAGGNYSYAYIYNMAPIAEEQLYKAGVRLAKLLNEIYK